MSIHAIDENIDPVAQTKIDLAAALRLAVYHELEEGIDNHFTVTLPGRLLVCGMRRTACR